MPAARPTRGRTRSKSAALRGVRPRLIHCEAEAGRESPATAAHPGGDTPGLEALMAATPRPGWQASLRGLRAETRHSLARMWAHKRFGLLMLGLWALMLLCYFLSPGFSNSTSPNEYVLWINKNADGQSPGNESVMETLLSFFSPTTCIPKENQVVEACNGQKDLNASECLKYKCCYSETSDFGCFVPLRDKPTQMFRMFLVGVSSVIILGFVPVCCCSFCRRSKWANPFQRKVNRILKGLKKQRNKPKMDTELLEAVTEDVEGQSDEREEESGGN
ncbi:FMR1 neighbor protein [Trichechus manatus latirostris]|uniref:FMR1 neighbor protein n=1 Tax=Trichechus manatus latirostris TaxID=127582 RepID=A0A2Y9FYC5_TRIMA|nr:FMR1 neighbor protein [Trichechus manatus latirostris]